MTTANSVLQDPSSVGNIMKTLSARIRSAKTELEDMGEEVDAVVESTSKLRDTVKGYTGFDIMEKDGKTYKDMYEILLGIGRQWDKLSDVDQAALAEALAGKRNANGLYSILQNPDDLQRAYETAMQAEGSAAREQENWEKSIQYSIDRMKAASEELATDFIESDWIKDTVDLLTKLIETIDKLIKKVGTLGPVLATGLTFMSNGGIKGIGKAFSDSSTAGLFTYKDVVTQSSTLNEEAYAEALRSKVEESYYDVSHLSTGELEELVDSNSLDEIRAGCQDITQESKRTVSGLGAIGKTLVSIGISAAISLIYEFATAQDKLNQSVQKAVEDYTTLSTTVDDYKKQIEADYAVLKDPSSTYEEIYQARQDLYNIQNDLIEQYPKEAKGLDLVTDSAEKQAKAYEQLNKIKANSWDETKNEINDGPWINNIINAFKGYNSNTEAEIDRLSNYGKHNLGPALNTGYGYNEKMLAAMEKRVESFTNEQGVARITGDIYEVYDAYLELQDIAEEFGEEKIAAAFGASANKVKSEIEEVGDFYEQHIYNEKILANENGEKETYEAYMDAYEKYQEAKTKSDEEATEASLKELTDIINKVDTSEWDQNVKDWFYKLIPELQDELDQATFEVKFKASPEDQGTDTFAVKVSSDVAKSGYRLSNETRTNRRAVVDALGYFGSSDEILNGYVTDGRIDQNKISDDLDAYEVAALNNIQKVADNLGVEVGTLIAECVTEGLIKSQTQIDFDEFNEKILAAYKNYGSLDELKEEQNARRKVISLTKDMTEEQQRFYLTSTKGAKTATEALNLYTKALAQERQKATKAGLVDNLTDLSGGFDSLGTIYKDIEDGGDFDFKQLATKNFDEAFSDMKDEYTEFISVVSSSPKDIEKCQAAFDKLVTSYIDQKVGLDNVDESTVGVLESMYEMYGIENAHEMAMQKLAEAEAEKLYTDKLLIEAGGNITEITGENAAALLEEAGASDLAGAALYRLYGEQILLNSTQLDLTQQCDALSDMAEMALTAAGAIRTIGPTFSPISSAESKYNTLIAQGYSLEEAKSLISRDMNRAYQSVIDEAFGSLADAKYTGTKTPKSGSSGSESSPKTYTWIEQAEKANERKRQAAANYLESSNYSYDDMADRIGGTQETQNAIREIETESKKLTNKWEATRKKLVTAFGEEYAALIEEDLANGTGAYGEWMSEYTELTGKEIRDSQYKLLDGAEELYAEMLDNQEELNYLREMGLESAANGENALLQADKERIELLEKEKELYSSKIWQDDIKALKEALGDTAETQALINKILSGDITAEGYRDIFTTEKGGTLSNEAQEALDTAIEDAEYMQDLDNEIFEAKEDLFNDEIALYEKHIQQLQSEADQIQAVMDEFNDAIDLKDTLGKLTTEGDYKSMIQTSKSLSESYKEQLAVLNDELEFIEAEGREESETYYNVLSQINDIEAAIRDCTQEQAEWNETIKNMPIDRVEKYLGILEDIAQDIENYLSVKDAKGVSETADEIQKQIAVSRESLTKLLEQAELYRKNLADYEWGSENYQETVDAIQEIENSISDIVVEMVEWNKQLLNLPIENISAVNDDLSLLSSALSDLGEDYDAALSAVSYVIDKQVDKINDEKDAFNELYDDKVEAIQDVIDALEKENEARSHQLALEDAQYELEKANTQKTIQVIKDGHLEYIADQEAIRSAQENLDTAQYENQVYKLQQQIDALEAERNNQNEIYEDQLEALNKQAEKWAEITSEIQAARDALSADEFLGDNWIEKVLGGTDSEIYSAFKALYKGLSDQQYSVDKQIESNERLVTVMQEYVDAYIAGEITYSEALAGINSLMTSFKDGITSSENLFNTLKLFQEGDVSSVLSSVQKMVSAEGENYANYLKLTEENNNIIANYTTTWQELTKSVDNQIEALKKAYEAAEAAAKAAAEAATVITTYASNSGSNGSSGGFSYIDTGWDYGPGTVDKYHEGSELGYVGAMTPDEKLKALQEMSLRPLEANEIPAILKRGELVLTSDQQSRVLSNFSKMSQLGQVGTVQKQTVVNMTLSNLTFNEVQNGQDFAQYIVKNLSSAVQQGINKR